MDTVAVGSASITEFIVDAASVTDVELSLDGTTWTSSITVLGSSVVTTTTDLGAYNQITVFATPVTAGETTFYLRAVTNEGTTAAFETSLRAYLTSSSFNYEVRNAVVSMPGVAMPVSSRQRRGPGNSSYTWYTPNGSFATNALGTPRINIAGSAYTGPGPMAGQWNAIWAFDVGGNTVKTLAYMRHNSIGPSVPGFTVDELGDVYMTINASPGTLTLYNNDNTTAFSLTLTSTDYSVLAKLRTDGTWAWAKPISGSTNPFAQVTVKGTELLVGMRYSGTAIGYDGNTYTMANLGSYVLKVNTTTGAVTGTLGVMPATATAFVPSIFHFGSSTDWGITMRGGAFTTTAGGSGTLSTGGIIKFSSANAVVAERSATLGAGTYAAATGAGVQVVADDTGLFYHIFSTVAPANVSMDAVSLSNTGAIGGTTSQVNFIFRLDNALTAQWGITYRNQGGNALSSAFHGVGNGQALFNYPDANPAVLETIAALDLSTGSVVWKSKPNLILTSLGGGAQMRGYVDEIGGNLYTGYDTGAGGGTLTNSDATTIAVPASTSRAIALSNDGFWTEAKFSGGVIPPDGGLEPPAQPENGDFPLSVLEGTYVTTNFTGYDPELPTTAQIYTLQVWDPNTEDWRDGSDSPDTITFSGKGTMGLPAPSGTLSGDVTFQPVPDFYGTVTFFARWTALTDAVGPFVPRIGPTQRFVLTYTNDPDQPTAPEGEMPEVNEDTTSIGVFSTTDLDFTGGYTWQFSPQTDDPRTTTGSSIRVKDGDGNEVGTANIQSQNNSLRTANIRFIPDAHWSGSASFSLRVSNGNLWSEWVVVSVTVNAVPDAPGALSPTTVPNINEDGYLEQTFTWSDPDYLYIPGSGDYTLQLSLASGPVAWSNMEVGQIFDLGDVRLTLVSISNDQDMTTTPDTLPNVVLRIEPKADWYGAYSFKARVVDASDEPTLYGTTTTISGDIISVPDTPSRVTPFTMPRAKPGQIVVQTFTTIDPDPENTSWTFETSVSPLGPWATTPLTFIGKGVIELIDADTSDKTAQIKFTADAGGYGRYQFYIRTTDNTGRVSPPSLVTGFVVGANINAFLQRIDRSVSPAVIRSLTPLTSIMALNITDALDGPGAASVVVSANEIATRAEALNLATNELLNPGAVELAVFIGSQPLWVGPINQFEYDAAGDGTVTINAVGLLSYFEARVIDYTNPKGKTNFTNEDHTDIIWTLVDDAQGNAAANLVLSDGTVPSGTLTSIEYVNTATISEAISELHQEADAPEVWIDPDRTFRVAPTRGLDKRAAFIINEKLGVSIRRLAKSDDVATAAVVTSDTHEGYYADATAIAKYGELVKYVEAPQLVSNAACLALAREIVLRSKEQTLDLDVSLVIDGQTAFTITDVGIGDLVNVQIDDPVFGTIDMDARVINMTIDLISESSDAFVVTMNLEQAVFVDGVLQGSRSRHVAELYAMAYEALYRT